MIYGQPITFGGKKAEGEIPITANGIYDVAEYASANVNVQSAPVLLWTNASPTSSFAPQTVRVETGYSAYLVEYAISTALYSSDYTGVALVNFSNNIQMSAVGSRYTRYYNAFYYNECHGRFIISCADGSIQFGNGTYRSNILQDYGTSADSHTKSESCSYNTGVAIPTRIWGVKFTLE